jgi:F-type H+-transporting ATPase subunit epsilon
VRVEKVDDCEEFVFVADGILEVQPNDVTVLADTAVRSGDLEEAKAQASKKHAEELMQSHEEQIDYVRAQAEMASAIAQLAAIQRLRSRGR